MKTEKYVAFLRGINVGGHHKLPMADLKKYLEKEGYKNIKTLLNSGNVMLDSYPTEQRKMQTEIAALLEKKAGFPVPTVVYPAAFISDLMRKKPFAGITIHPQLRLYVSLFPKEIPRKVKTPQTSPDGGFTLLKQFPRCAFSILDISKTQSPKGMEVLEKLFGKDITTRNWNTLEKMAIALI